MYYRYKSKQRSKKGYKILFVIGLLVVAGYFLYQNRDYLLFWKYDYNNLVQKIEQAENITSFAERTKEIEKYQELCLEYKKENPTSFSTFFLTSKFNFLLAEAKSGKSFDTLFLEQERLEDGVIIPLVARKYYIQVVKDILKGMALSKRSTPPDEQLLMFAKSLYYLKYYDIDTIYTYIQKIREPELLTRIDDRRFYAIMHILYGKEEKGIDFLLQHGLVEGDSFGRLILATAYVTAKQYTNAIVEYKNQLNRVSDKNLVKRIQMNLGRIYLKQSLYKQALTHFMQASELFPQDTDVLFCIAKSYLQLGKRQLAKKYSHKILSIDRTNEQARVLLRTL